MIYPNSPAASRVVAAVLVARQAIEAAASDLVAAAQRRGPTKDDKLRAQVRILVALHFADAIIGRAASAHLRRRRAA